jgi:two-component system nitrate/nitrite response regulator NarL
VAAILEGAHKHPNVIVVSADLADGPLAGFNALRDLHMMKLRSRCVMLFDNFERELVIATFRAGAGGIFFRDAPIELFCKCIERVHQGQIWAGSKELGLLVEALSSAVPLRSVTRNPGLLSGREEEIVNLVAQGFTNRQVSQKLNLSEHTIKNYLFRIFDKLGISSRVELALYSRDRSGAA